MSMYCTFHFSLKAQNEKKCFPNPPDVPLGKEVYTVVNSGSQSEVLSFPMIQNKPGMESCNCKYILGPASFIRIGLISLRYATNRKSMNASIPLSRINKFGFKKDSLKNILLYFE